MVTMSAESIERLYGVTYRVGERVRREGRLGTVEAFPDNYVSIRFDGDAWPTRCHPRFRIERVYKQDGL